MHLTPIFFLLNKSLHLFETYCAIWRLFQPNLDFLKAVKVTKSIHHLSHDQASKGHGSIPYLTSQTDLHCFITDGAYYCYCAYVLRIARYSGFLWVVTTNSGIFLRGLKLYGESRTQQMLLVSQKKIRGNHAFFRDN